jgi:YD repeat-containing protein
MLRRPKDGAEIYVFDGRGRHLRTVDALTNALRFEFAYDAKGLLVGIKDASGNLSVVERGLRAVNRSRLNP